MADSYYDRPEWAQSEMKLILDSGIDVAVAAKRGMLPKPASRAIDLGQLAHMFVLGGNPDDFIVSPYADFRTKEAKNWKAEAEATCKTIVTKEQYDTIAHIVDNIEAHPLSQKWLKGADVRHEVEMYGEVSGVKIRAKLDAVSRDGEHVNISDIKTTAQFDKWKRNAMRSHYDLQAAEYALLSANVYKVNGAFVKFRFCVAETVAPYRVQWFDCSTEFLEHGFEDLSKCISEIKAFGDREPNFLIQEVGELGDWSL